MKHLKNLVVLFALAVIPFQLWSQDEERHPLLDDKFYVELGVFVPQKDIKLGANGESDNGDIDFGETFDFNDNEATFFANAEWRWNKKWRLTAEYFAVNNAARAQLDEDIVFEDITFKEGSYVRGGVEFALFRVFVGRVISSGQKHSLGAGLGVHAINIGAFIQAEIDTDLGNVGGERRNVSALIPLPNIGGWYHWAPNKKWALVARVDWFGATIDKYSGGLWNLAPGVKYQIIKNLGIGIDYRFLFLNARVNDSNWNGDFEMNFAGPLFTLHANF